MPLTYLDPGTIGTALSCAWRTHLGTSESPSNDGKWLTNGANNDGIGLYGGLTDSLPASLTLDTDAATTTTTALLCDKSDINNLNGLNAIDNSVSLSYLASTTTSETHTVTQSVTLGEKFTLELNQVVAKESMEFSLSFTFTSTESETNSTTTTQTETTTVPVYVPAGKVYQAVLTAEVQQITVPYTCVIKVTGTTETWFNNQVNGHYNYSTDAGTAFGWINSDNCAGTDSSSYSDAGNGTGYVTLTGSVTMNQTVNFSSQVTDVTSQYT
jgi:hypothetical protein